MTWLLSRDDKYAGQPVRDRVAVAISKCIDFKIYTQSSECTIFVAGVNEAADAAIAVIEAAKASESSELLTTAYMSSYEDGKQASMDKKL